MVTRDVGADSGMSGYIADVMSEVVAKNPAEVEFHQAVGEVVESLGPVLASRTDTVVPRF